jgi:glycopeptide antibiotics resistance protein
VVNLAVYLPVGAILYGWVQPTARRRDAAILIATIGGIGLSLGLEVLQTMSSVRCASWVDVVVNAFGALLGAVAAPSALQIGQRLIERVRRVFIQGPTPTVGLLLTLGLIVHGVTPFDFVLKDQEFDHGLMRSLWWPMAERAAPTPADGELAPYAPLVSAVGMAGAFALLGCVGAMANRQRGLPPLAALWGSIGHGAVVAVILEVLQLFSRSQVFDTADIAANAVAAAIGAWSAVAVLEPVATARNPRSPASAIPAFLIGALVLAQIAYATLRAVSPVHFSWAPLSWTDMGWAPFAVQFRMPFLTALGSMVSSFLPSTLLAATAAWYEWRRFGGVRWARIGLIVVATVTLCEMAQLGTRTHVADLTELIIGLLAVATCRAAWMALLPPHEASPQAT